MPTLADFPGAFILPTVTYNTAALSTSTAAAGQLSGAPFMIMNNSGGTPGNYTMRTAAQMIADSNNLTVGTIWYVLLVNGQGTGTLTLVTAAGITLSGTLTVAALTARLYIFQMNTPTTILGAGQLWSFTATALAFGA